MGIGCMAMCNAYLQEDYIFYTEKGQRRSAGLSHLNKKQETRRAFSRGNASDNTSLLKYSCRPSGRSKDGPIFGPATQTFARSCGL